MTMQRIAQVVLVCVLGGTLIGCAGTSKVESTGEYIDDTAITSRVKAAFLNDPLVSALAVNVETFKGVVQLSGFVKTVAERNRAVQLTRAVPGVRLVRNDILIR